MKKLINELIVDAYGCKTNLSNAIALERAARKSIKLSGAKIVGSLSHRFQPHGLTLCVILKESHFILSTWPEYQLAVANIFLCSDRMDPYHVWDRLCDYLRPSHCVYHTVKHRLQGINKRAAA